MIDEWNIGARSVANGRWAMVLFMIGGVLLTLFPNKTLFDAVAVTGTASMFLTPVMAVTFMGGRVSRAGRIWFRGLRRCWGRRAYMYRGY